MTLVKAAAEQVFFQAVHAAPLVAFFIGTVFESRLCSSSSYYLVVSKMTLNESNEVTEHFMENKNCCFLAYKFDYELERTAADLLRQGLDIIATSTSSSSSSSAKKSDENRIILCHPHID